MTFAEKLRELRDQAGLSEARLAKASGVPFGTVHDYGLGRRTPSFPAVVKLAKALGSTCETFADCDDIVGEPTAERENKGANNTPKKPRGRPRKEK